MRTNIKYKRTYKILSGLTLAFLTTYVRVCRRKPKKCSWRRDKSMKKRTCLRVESYLRGKVTIRLEFLPGARVFRNNDAGERKITLQIMSSRYGRITRIVL